MDHFYVVSSPVDYVSPLSYLSYINTLGFTFLFLPYECMVSSTDAEQSTNLFQGTNGPSAVYTWCLWSWIAVNESKPPEDRP